MMLKIIDNPMPLWAEQSFEREMYRYPLEYNHHILRGSAPFFGRCLYNRQTGVETTPPRGVSNLMDCMIHSVVADQYPGYQYGDTHRVVVNGMTSVNSPGAHTDYDEPDIMTAVYMLLGNSGDLMVGLERIQYKPHRLAIFPANVMHEALTPSEGDWRVTVAVNFTLVSAGQ